LNYPQTKAFSIHREQHETFLTKNAGIIRNFTQIGDNYSGHAPESVWKFWVFKRKSAIVKNFAVSFVLKLICPCVA